MQRRCVDASGQHETSSKCMSSRTDFEFSKESLPETYAKFSTHNVPFTKVCDRVIGHQFIILLMIFVTSRRVQIN